MPVVDASVYVAYAYAKDIAHARSQAWMTSAVASSQILVAPATFLAEVAGAISRNSGRPRLAHSVIRHLLQAERAMQAAGYRPLNANPVKENTSATAS